MKKKIKTQKVKKAKLITDGGFYKIIPLEDFKLKIDYPLFKKVTFASPETNIFDMNVEFFVEFSFRRIHKGYAEYEQFNVTTSVAK